MDLKNLKVVNYSISDHFYNFWIIFPKWTKQKHFRRIFGIFLENL